MVILVKISQNFGYSGQNCPAFCQNISSKVKYWLKGENVLKFSLFWSKFLKILVFRSKCSIFLSKYWLKMLVKRSKCVKMLVFRGQTVSVEGKSNHCLNDDKCFTCTNQPFSLVKWKTNWNDKESAIVGRTPHHQRRCISFEFFHFCCWIFEGNKVVPSDNGQWRTQNRSQRMQRMKNRADGRCWIRRCLENQPSGSDFNNIFYTSTSKYEWQ